MAFCMITQGMIQMRYIVEAAEYDFVSAQVQVGDAGIIDLHIQVDHGFHAALQCLHQDHGDQTA